MFAIIPAGGVGSRLWPLSRSAAPKFLLDLTGDGRSMVRATVDRLAPVSAGGVVVTGVAHAPAVTGHLAGTGVEVIAEPSPRDSMAAIGLAAAVLHERHGDVVVGSFAADHVIRDEAAFHAAVRAAEEIAAAGWLTTIGTSPTEPSSAFGYIEQGQALPAPLAGRLVVRFEEKPDAARAAAYLGSGRHLWNAGMFVVRTGVLLDALAELHPALHDGLRALGRAWDTPGRADALAATWPRLDRMVIDRALAEPLSLRGGVAVVPADMGWSDIGDFDAVAALAPSPPAVTVGADGAWVRATRPVAVVGIPGAVVVETPDAILVTTRAASQDVKAVVDRLTGPLEGLR